MKTNKYKRDNAKRILKIYQPIYHDYVFRSRKTDLKFWLMIIAIIVLVVIVGHQEVKELKLKQQIKECQAQRQEEAHIWIMDSSCSDQLLNSQDHVLRIRLTK